MSQFQQILTEAGELWLSEVAAKFDQYDLNATGKTLSGLKYTVQGNRLTITSERPFPYTLQDGRAPASPGSSSNGQFLAALEEWVKAKGIEIPVWAIKNKINKEGTRLFRGEDPRFTKPTDVISSPTDATVEFIRGKVGELVLIDVRSRIKRVMEGV